MDNEIIMKYDLLIKKIASKFYNASFDDLYQVGSIGLLKALKNYNKDLNIKFSTYAYQYIYGEMYHYVVENQNIRVNKDVFKMYQLIEKCKNKLIMDLEREPSELEICNYLNITLEEYLMVTECIGDYLSLDDFEMYNYVADDKRDINDNRLMLKELINNLDPLDQELIIKRYYYDYTQSEISEELGISQVTVSRKEKVLIKQLHDLAA